eukprot:CAMPEP_0194338586 /NCGR_PEP_ID=MMETSP0171-20130528/80106_1 /TAXON_ID=218684 /ORGANISM="Corethron pennatum, Strain L29A3" /LENGTH=157 /DNA_ID=CAMNT_0039102773 /DNA_START=312 /DNA_END=786 /DNA_ORIENTATION=-
MPVCLLHEISRASLQDKVNEPVGLVISKTHLSSSARISYVPSSGPSFIRRTEPPSSSTSRNSFTGGRRWSSAASIRPNRAEDAAEKRGTFVSATGSTARCPPMFDGTTIPDDPKTGAVGGPEDGGAVAGLRPPEAPARRLLRLWGLGGKSACTALIA